jgi:hypothetical protein
LYCLQAANTTNSGPKTPINPHLKFLIKVCAGNSSCGGILRCIADHTHSPKVSRQEKTREIVPLPVGSDTQPTVEAVALLVAIAIGVLAERIDMVIPRDRSEVSCGWWCLVLEVYTCDNGDDEEESQALLGAFLLRSSYRAGAGGETVRCQKYWHRVCAH